LGENQDSRPHSLKVHSSEPWREQRPLHERLLYAEVGFAISILAKQPQDDVSESVKRYMAARIFLYWFRAYPDSKEHAQSRLVEANYVQFISASMRLRSDILEDPLGINAFYVNQRLPAEVIPPGLIEFPFDAVRNQRDYKALVTRFSKSLRDWKDESARGSGPKDHSSNEP
jgi:hypothetical protein